MRFLKDFFEYKGPVSPPKEKIEKVKARKYYRIEVMKIDEGDSQTNFLLN